MKRVEVLAGHFAGTDTFKYRTTYEVEYSGVLKVCCVDNLTRFWYGRCKST